jgi:Peptidase family S41/N-terminal domain of Peptidase_S41 in eukaryotic IRBP
MKRIAAVLLCALSLEASARSIDDAERRAAAELVPHLLETLYVIPEKGKELATLVRASFESGKYDSAKTSEALADAINADLAVANDRHLRVRLNPAREFDPPVTIAAWEERRAKMRTGGTVPGLQEAMRRARIDSKVLDGNVGYLSISEFVHSEDTRKAIDAAMAALAGTKAVIVDVRECPGGSGEIVSYLASYFFPDEKRVLMKRYHRPSDSRRDSTTVDVRGKRMPDTPLYILTGPRSASACESFAFTLQQWGRAKTVGEKTAGAGYNNMIVSLGMGLDLSVSVGTATHPKTNQQFEAVGVQPDIAAPAARALEAALERLAMQPD